MKQVCRRYCWGRCCRWGSRPSLRCEQGGTILGKGEADLFATHTFVLLLPPQHGVLVRCATVLADCAVQTASQYMYQAAYMSSFVLPAAHIFVLRMLYLSNLLLYLSNVLLQAALQYMYKADGTEDWESIQDPGIKLLIAQCHALLGTTKLHEAGATRVRPQCWGWGGRCGERQGRGLGMGNRGGEVRSTTKLHEAGAARVRTQCWGEGEGQDGMGLAGVAGDQG